jgi:MFS transporter, DHA3 family, macrolide efflux protein
MTGFILVWIGQLVSIMATTMSQFSISVWAFEKTGSATALGLAQVFYITPFLIISPLAGVMIDRYNRKLMMMVSDLGAVCATMFVLLMSIGGALEIWHLYVASAVTGLFSAFQWPAYSASISLMVPKEQLGRANGMMSLLESAPAVLAPVLAGLLYSMVGLTPLLLFDVATFVIAVLVLAGIHVPQPERSSESKAAGQGLLSEAAYGFRYIFSRPSLLGLQLVFLIGNLFSGLAWNLLTPMVLARTGQNELLLGTVLSAGSIGGVLGGIAMTAWGGFKRRAHGVLLGHALLGLTQLAMGLGQAPIIWIVAVFLDVALIPLINTSNQAIWQAKVAPDVQGRVFAARRLIAWITNPLTPLIGGLVADRALEPAMRDGGSVVAQIFGRFVGVGPGAGMGLVMAISSIGVILVGVLGYLFRVVRDAEALLPDHNSAQA